MSPGGQFLMSLDTALEGFRRSAHVERLAPAVPVGVLPRKAAQVALGGGFWRPGGVVEGGAPWRRASYDVDHAE